MAYPIEINLRYVTMTILMSEKYNLCLKCSHIKDNHQFGLGYNGPNRCLSPGCDCRQFKDY